MTLSEQWDPCAYIRQMYNVPARVGMRVIVNGRSGVIIDATHHLIVDFGQGELGSCHPTWRIEYVAGEPDL